MKHKKIFLLSLLIILIFILSRVFHLEQYFKIAQIREILNQYGFWSYLIYICLFSIGNIIQVPGWIFLGASILALGSVQGYFLTLAAAYISCTISFLMISYFGKGALKEISLAWVQRILLKIETDPVKVNIVLRLVFQTAPPLNYTLALSGVSFRHYFLGVLFGLPIPILIYTIFIEKIANIVL